MSGSGGGSPAVLTWCFDPHSRARGKPRPRGSPRGRPGPTSRGRPRGSSRGAARAPPRRPHYSEHPSPAARLPVACPRFSRQAGGGAQRGMSELDGGSPAALTCTFDALFAERITPYFTGCFTTCFTPRFTPCFTGCFTMSGGASCRVLTGPVASWRCVGRRACERPREGPSGPSAGHTMLRPSHRHPAVAYSSASGSAPAATGAMARR